MVEEQHVTQYGSLLKPCMSRLENLLVHQYVECILPKMVDEPTSALDPISTSKIEDSVARLSQNIFSDNFLSFILFLLL